MRKLHHLILCIGTLLFYPSARGSDLAVMKCNNELRELLKNWKSQDFWQWRGDEIYTSPAEDFGEWIVVVPENGGVTATKANESNEIRVHFTESCQRKLTAVEKPNADSFLTGDNFLKDKIKDGKGVIYLWSRQMPLSIKGIAEVQKAAKELSLKVIILMDEKSKSVKNNYFLQDNASVNSFELKMRNAYLHFPTLLVFESGKIKNIIKYGYENKDEYKKNIQSMLSL